MHGDQSTLLRLMLRRLAIVVAHGVASPPRRRRRRAARDDRRMHRMAAAQPCMQGRPGRRPRPPQETIPHGTFGSEK
jgi:hypothetical protein